MNKIYKVIWSKVKHQYVVVSELAHRDGKRSSAASKSIRTLMAVLAVCGMTAFGLGMQDVYAADRETVTAEDGVAQTKEYQYVAIKTIEVGNKKTYEDKNGTSYTYHSETVEGVRYWVRDGYSIKLKTGDRYPGAAKHVQVVAYKTSADPSVDAGLLKSDQIMIEAAKDEDNHAITTFTGSVLNDVSAGTYVGATNEGGTQTPDSYDYIIQDSDGKYKNVTNATAIDGKKPKFVEAVKQADGTYTVNGEIVGTDNLYVIGEVTTTEGLFWNPTTTKNTHYRLGAFVTSEGKIYDGRVFGLNNEVLMTAKEDDGTYYSYWAADTDDPMSPITNMTMGQFNTALKTIDDNSRMLAGDDIKQVDIAANGDGKTGGTIGLLRRGTYNTDTGKWEGTEYTPGIITVTSEGGIGGSGAENDVKIKFSNQENPDGFAVDAGTKVEAVQAAGSDKISTLKINGQEYALGTGGTVQGNFNTMTGEISITQDGQSVLAGKVHDWKLESGSFDANTGKLTLNTKDSYGTETDKVEIDGIAGKDYVDRKDKLNVKYDSVAKNIVTLGGSTYDSETHEGGTTITNVADGKNASDAVNFSQLSEVKREAGKHTTIEPTGTNITVTQNSAKGEALNYTVDLNPVVTLDGTAGDDKQIVLDGNNGTISATNSISVGEALVIDGNKKTVNGLSNKTWSKDSFVSGQAATEDQLDAMADWTETQVNNSGWTASTNGGKKDEKTEAITNGETVDFSNTDSNIKVSQDVTANGTSIKFNLNDDLLLGANAEGAGINISGTAGEIVIKSANGSAINIGNGVITGLTNTVSNENWETFMNSDLGNNGSRAVTEDDLQLVAQHSVQYKTNDDGTIDYNNIFLSGASYSSDGHTGGTMITNVAYASDSDGSAAVNVDKLHDAISDAKTEVTNADKHLNYDKTYSVDRETNKVNLEVVDNQGNVVGNTTIEDVASATDVGNIGDLNSDIAHDSTGDGNVSIVDAVNNVDNKVGDLNYKHDDGSDLNYVTAGDSVTGAIGDLDAAIKDAATEAGQHSSVSGSDNITVENGTNGNGGTGYKVSLDDDLALGGKEGQNGSIAITGSEGTITASGNVSAGSFTTGSITINGANEDGTHTGTINGLSNKTWDANNIVSGQAATEDQLKAATEGAVQYDRNEDGTVNKGSITLGGSTYNEETHEGGTTITNVADGKNASDAVNMSQLWQTNQAVINNSNNISMLSNSVNKLDNRIDRVGAGAAALAALHPLDFDPDAKWDFAAGYGNYRGANAVAVGAYYRPNEDVMFSVGGSMGGGENMVNAGVSLKIGAGSSGVTTSRVAMAKEIKAMRDVVAKQDAQIQKLTAMVNALVGIQAEPDTTTMFPDVPENHWAYEAVEAMAKSGLVKGYPDGEFKGDRTMTRYEFAQIVYNAIQAGAEVDARLVEEFKPELEYFHIATVAKDKDGNPTIERVRAN